MADVTIARGGTSVTVPLLVEGGDVLIARDVTLPNAKIEEKVAGADPRASNQFAGYQTLTMSGRLHGASAYADAHSLAEELIKPNSGGEALTASPSGVSGYQASYEVAPQPGSTLRLRYSPGERQQVGVEMQLPVVDSTVGTGDTGGVTNSFVTPDPDGTPTFTSPVSGQSVDVDTNVSITREVGRPNAQIRPQPSSIKYIDKRRAASDIFEIEARFTDANGPADAQTLVEDILLEPLGRDAYTLDFDSLYGLSSYDVVPARGNTRGAVQQAADVNQRRAGPLSLRVVRSV